MAEILVFRARPGAANEVAPRYAESAQILFFTGVRYHRMEDAAQDAIAHKAPRRRGKLSAPRKPPRKRA